jgi:hypothetical protein
VRFRTIFSGGTTPTNALTAGVDGTRLIDSQPIHEGELVTGGQHLPHLLVRMPAGEVLGIDHRAVALDHVPEVPAGDQCAAGLLGHGAGQGVERVNPSATSCAFT